jgi:hypothetical protein
MAFSDSDPFLRATVDAIGRLAQTRADFREINLRFSISRQDIRWRTNAADEYAHDFERESSKPVTDDRYYQETKALFGFFTSALSALECIFFAAYFVGHAAIDPTKITAATVRERFKRSRLVSLFKEHFPHDPFTQSLVQFIGDKGPKTPADQKHEEIRDIRDALSHRATPGRSMHLSNSSGVMALIPDPFTWLLSDLICGATDQVLDKDFLLDRQDWLERTIRSMATELDNFANANLPKT